MNQSPEQTLIGDAFGNPASGNIVVEAGAGCGKTTTIKMSIARAPEARILVACFNVRTKEEAKEKITDDRVDVLTLNGLGHRFVTRVWKGIKPDDQVEHDRIDSVTMGLSVADETKAMIHRLVGFLKNLCTNLPTQEQAYKIMKARGCDGFDDREDEIIVCAARRVLELSMKPDKQGRISFNDQVWLPVVMNWAKPLYNFVIIDEYQDMNICQLTMARRASSGRVALVGDLRQAIYDFRGAATPMMLSSMKVLLNVRKPLTLSTTFRCAKSIVRLANETVRDYHAAPSAPEGLVESIGNKRLMDTAKPGDAILSRLNAPLMPVALALLRNRIPARIEGRDIGQQLCTMVRSLKARSVPNFFERVEAWREKQIARHLKSKNCEKKCEQTNDIADTLKAIGEGANSVSDIFSRIESLFTNTDTNTRKTAVILSSVHKAKGLEWPRVFLLCETFRRGKGLEEDNIWYVAVTRAMRELYLVGGQAATKTEPAAVKSALPEGQEEARAEIPPTSNLPKLDNRPNSFSLCGGHVFHQRGNVVTQGGVEWVCEAVTDCNARFRSLERIVKSTDEDGKEVDKTLRGNRITSFSNQTEPGLILRRMTEAEIQEFLTKGKARPSQEQQTKQPVQSEQAGQQEGQEVMGKAKAKKTERVSQAGLNPMIHKLRDEGVNQTEAYAKVSKKYGFGEPREGHVPNWFKAVWAKKTAVKKVKAKASAKTPPPPKKKSKPAASVKKSPPPPPAAPAPKSTPPPPAASTPPAPAPAPTETVPQS